MATTFVEKDLLELERAYWQAVKDRNLDAAIQLTDFPCIISGSRGVRRVDRDTFRGMWSRSMPRTPRPGSGAAADGSARRTPKR